MPLRNEPEPVGADLRERLADALSALDATMTNPSIIAKVRSDAYRHGWNQASQIQYDSAYEDGRKDGCKIEARSHKWWWVFGLVCGVIVGVLI